MLVDYKTGTPPGMNEILVGFAPQLTLEAAMAVRGAFNLGWNFESVEALYLKLGGARGGEERPVDFSKSKANFIDVADDHYRALKDLLNQFRDPATPYPPRPFPKFAKRYNAYDHLARVKEWSLGGAAGEAAACNGILRHPGRHAGQTAPSLKSKPVGLGIGQCRIGQDACSREPCHPASPPRRRALKNPLPDLHQGGGREHGCAGLR